MANRPGDATERLQRLNTIYAWSVLLERDTIDAESKARAVESIRRNAERLLGQLTGTLECC